MGMVLAIPFAGIAYLFSAMGDGPPPNEISRILFALSPLILSTVILVIGKKLEMKRKMKENE